MDEDDDDGWMDDLRVDDGWRDEDDGWMIEDCEGMDG